MSTREREVSLLSLPPEVRSLVYGHIFVDGSVSAISPHESDPRWRTTSLPNILFVNRLCYEEAKPIFYSLVKFNIIWLDHWAESMSHAGIVRPRFGQNAKLVRHVYFDGQDVNFVNGIRNLFPNLTLFEMSLGDSFYHSDQINFERAMRYALRYGEWKSAIKDALDERFGPGMRDAVARLRHLGPNRGFKVRLHWNMSYRFVDFRGKVDLDEWILRIWDPAGVSSKTYEIPQRSLELTWCEGRLTLPCRESVSVPS